MASTRGSVAWFVVATIAVGLFAFAVVLGSGKAAVRELAGNEAMERACVLPVADAHEVGLRITDAMVDGSEPTARARLARMVEQVVHPRPGGPVVRVKLWKVEAGTAEIVYSDLPALVGRRVRLGREQSAVLRTGEEHAKAADLDRAEERTERRLGPLTEVYTRVLTPDRQPLLLETYQRSEQIVDDAADIAAEFTPVLVRTLVVAAALELLLATILIRRFRRRRQEREALMAGAIETSAQERRTIAGDLDDGPVQEMAGLCVSLDTQARTETDEHVRGTLQQIAATGRDTLRSLQSAIVGLHPLNLDRAGLERALSDLLTRLPGDVRGHLDYQVGGKLNVRTSELLYRTSQEAVRTIERHGASHVWISVQHHSGSVFLSVHDDGPGGAATDPQVTSRRLGLAVLADVIRDAGGRMHVTSTGTGTTLTVQVPA